MKKIVLYIDNMNRGGAQRVMGNLAEHFLTKGFKVILINDYPPDGQNLNYEVSSRIQRVYLRNSYTKNFISNNFVRMRKLRSLIKCEKPDVVLSFLGGPNIRMLVSTMGINVKKFVSVRNDPNKEYGKNRFKRVFVRKLFEQASGCIFQTEDAAQYFTEAVRHKSTIIYNPVAEKFFNTKLDDSRHGIITVGRLNQQKNHFLLISAFARIADEFPEEHLIIYGEGSLREQLETYIKDKGLENRISMPGNILDVEQVLCKAKVFVLSSDYEGMPNALMEAMTVGLPSISTDCPCGGPRMLIQNEQQGILIPCRSEDKMADALRTVLGCNELQEKLGKNAKKRASAFLSDKVLEQWDEFLFSVTHKDITLYENGGTEGE